MNATKAEIGTVADDAQRYLLRAVLADACEWHHVVLDGCEACRLARGCCLAHWDAHQVPADTYSDLSQVLAGYDGSARPSLLSAAQQQIIMTALGEAITHRATLGSPADIALTAAYRTLAGRSGSAGPASARNVTKRNDACGRSATSAGPASARNVSGYPLPDA
jgi:hypothetical protein